MTIEGGCWCGAVRFRIAAEPISARVCWRRNCQFLGSGGATVNVVFPTAAMQLTGETTDYVSVADSGAVMHRRFCPKCGTPLFSEAESRPHLIIVRGGALDEPVRPQATIWTASAPPWGHVDPETPAFETSPPPAIGKPVLPT